MNTVRVARQWVYTGRGQAGMDRRRGLILAPFLCASLFAGCFAIGRAASPRSGPRAEAPPSLQVAFAGAAIPFRLSDVPPIQVQAAARASAPAQAGGHSVSAPSAGVTAYAPSEETHGAQGPIREVARAPAPASPQLPAPAPASARSGGGGEDQSKPRTSSSTSFDSSG
jgi:hypothetical protein